MKELDLHEVAQALGSDSRVSGRISSVSTDTRSIEPGSLFFALRGERFDGHLFAGRALEEGAACVVADRKVDIPDDRVIYVKSTRQAFLDMAQYYRSQFSLLLVAVTGSVGKTTTKEMIAAVLESRYKTLKTQGNYNNEVGLPKTLLRLDDSFQAGVIEMGMSAFGEIHELTVATRPQMAVVTVIGVSHIEHLGSRENILKAKLEITDGLEKGSPLILNGDDDLLCRVKDENFHIYLYGIDNPDCDIRAVDLCEQADSTSFAILWNQNRYEARIPCIGRHNVLNALAAFLTGVLLEIAPETCIQALLDYVPSGMRQRTVRHNGYTVVEDCYNASPDSMTAALTTLSGMRCEGRKIAVLSDMLELGEYAEQSHRETGALAAKLDIGLLLTYGDESAHCVDAAREAGMSQAYHFEDKQKLYECLKRSVREGDIVWFKASRGMKLEEIINKLYEEC
ncbi:UDP-N-acetylmuramoyl-tripeptide--D-alanyl-D-alanine ligase [Candidatus Soleaferrea massiliensis]|uniref:UDP-N-acetylmuramoyl-tripeptide--D-alanyl-D- alanine ligase n=1 Tax=Candidatus Soleaferrea massiliensis TaxID=1470354 RepID=UPI00058C27DB|nr:UDP-N-acetylmuramoyl-tripeptide--D-alanyl-D-alanine ligase [Candidatus Soleaferrea massiliensis]